MQNPVLVVCQMLEDEVCCIQKKHKLNIPTIWVDRGLHDYPSRLHKKITEIIRELDHSGHDGIILGFMICGNALDGIRAGELPIVFPRFHDCIDMQLSELRDPYALYLTPGWMKGPAALQNVFLKAAEQYGEKKAKKFLDLSLKNYRSLIMIDTGAYSYEEALEISTWLSELSGLPLKKCRGNYSVLEKLLTGNWDDQFCVLQPHEFFSATRVIMEP